ncbi:mediator of replication checkpoint protein 1 [[Candida] railenensis]|uniref:Mediator of replication checkpoint protein 1 n=1 Tax=[Candida] railenensis TaxID=45579 RepID=A0A9P0QPB6_9ASCO|nr:mediator of replication checkpoint protein 1 [[Candida] railenensis]
MDLLDNLEDRGGRKFEVQYNTQIIDRDTQQDVDSEIETEKSDYEEGYAEEVSDDNILDKVKQKLAQLDMPESNSTQMGEPSWDFGNSMLTQTQVIHKEVQPNHHLPQLDLNDVEIEQETQSTTLKSPSLQPSSPIGEYEDETQVIPLSKEDRMAKISKLAELKREQRLAKEKEANEEQMERKHESESLLADITHTTLTDEEEDLLEANQSVVSSDLKNPSDKNLKEIEEFLQIQKRSRNLQPQFKKKNVFTAENLLQEFNDDENDEEQSETESNIGLHDDPENKNSPITSPVKNKAERKYDDLEDDNHGHLPSDPISEYAHNLKTQLLSSPSKKEYNEPKMIDLDSDDDSNGGSDAYDDKENNEIPALTKDEILHIKQKYLLKKISSNPKSKLNHLPKSIRNSINNQQRHNESKILINNLQRANINQLQVHKKFSPLHDELIEMEKDEEVMGSLLERELERVRNIRKKEKLMEKAKNALLNGDVESGYDNNEQNEDVPDSDFDQSFNEDEDEDEDDEDDGDDDDEVEDKELKSSQDYQGIDDLKSKRKSKRVILSDDDEERKDDSYMFGAKSNDNEESLNAHHEGYITTGSSENITPTTIIDDIPIESQKYELFQNLKGRIDSTNSETQKSEFLDLEDISHLRVPSFQEIESQKDAQVLTQPDTTLATQIDGQTQRLSQVSKNYEDDDDDITPANVRKGRILIRRNNISDIEEEDEQQEKEEEEEEIPMNEEEVQAQIKLYEQKMRRQELKSRKKRKEMERKGLKDIVQGEAEESEDEWHGLGGIDAELSDEQANSEDEKMIDNNFNIDLNDEEVRRKFMEQYQIKDKKDLEKLLDDIKNHKLTKRIGSKNGFDIELSDEEDELLTAYRKQRMIEQRERLMENKKIQELAKNEKSKAFFTSIQDSTLAVKIDNDEERKTDSEVESAVEEGEESEKELAMELDTKKRKTIKLKESFVQKQLSFLRTMGDDEEEVEYFKQQRISNRQYGFDSDEENLEDLQTMKRRCMESLVQGKNSNSRISSIIDDRGRQNSAEAEDTDADQDEDDSEFIPSFKRPSLVKSFRSSNEIEVGSFTGVTIRKHYKAANGSNASISGASSNSLKKAAAKTSSLKEKRISRSISNSRNGSGLFQSNGFENS